MWSGDAQHEEHCRLCDIHLPPHRGRVRWLGDWEVDFSPLSDCALHRRAPLGSEDWGSRESPSNSPHESPRRGLSVDSSTGSVEVVVSVSQPQIITTTIGTSSPAVSSTSSYTPTPPPSSGDFKEGVTYAGGEEGFIYFKPPLCDKKGWLYTSRSLSCRWADEDSHEVLLLIWSLSLVVRIK